MAITSLTAESKRKSLVSKIESSEKVHNLLPGIIDDLKSIFDCEAIVLFSLDREGKQLISRNFITNDSPKIQIPLTNKSVSGYVSINGKALNISDVTSKAELSMYHPQMKIGSSLEECLHFSTNSLIVMPLPANKKLIGVVEIVNKRKNGKFTGDDFKIAKELAPTLGLLLSKLGPETNDPQTHKSSAGDPKTQMFKIVNAIHSAKNVDEILIELKSPILDVFDASLITIYAVDSKKNEIYSKLKSGDSINEIRLPVSSESIAGCVALEKRPATIHNVYDKNELRNFHPKLTFDSSWDQKSGFKTKSMLVYPFHHRGKLMGVLQLINKKNGHKFDNSDENNAKLICDTLALAFFNQTKFIPPKPTKFSFLLANGIITDQELNSAIAKARRNQLDIEMILLDEFKVKRSDLGRSLENFFKIPYVGFDPSIVLPSSLFEGLNLGFLNKNVWVPIKKDDQHVTILIDNPYNQDKVQNIKLIFPKRKIQFKVSLRADIRDYLNSTVAEDRGGDPLAKGEEMSTLLDALRTESADEEVETITEDGDLNAISETDSTIVKLVNKVLTDAYDQGISDIHIEPGIGNDNMQVRFRKDGVCRVFQEIPPMYKQAVISRIKIMSRLDIAERRMPQDGKIKMRYGKKDIEYRVATCPTVGGNEDAVLRILAASKPIPLDKMGFSKRNLELICASSEKPYGLILVVGPTGSGKTTTLHSTLGNINTPERKIWTAEDPVEITQKGLRQVQMLPKIGLDFARAMRSSLRGDPDVIMVGEMRDAETCSIGLAASLTGHLVLSTLHTNSAPETITRLLDMGMNPLNFADALILVAAQRLARTLCKHCKEDYHPNKEEFEQLAHEYGEKDFKKLGIKYSGDLKLKQAKGCDRCNNTGYLGRIGVHEVLEATDTMKRMIMKQALVEELREQAQKDGMVTLKQDGIQKIFLGHTDLKQILAVCII